MLFADGRRPFEMCPLEYAMSRKGDRSQDTYPSLSFTRSGSERLVNEITLNDYETQNVHFLIDSAVE
jgi:hypothetical protein